MSDHGNLEDIVAVRALLIAPQPTLRTTLEFILGDGTRQHLASQRKSSWDCTVSEIHPLADSGT
jgi:hypothetical protein